MPYTVLQAKDDLSGMMKGTTSGKITNVLQLLNRASRDVLGYVDPQETKRKAQIASAVYDEVYDYAAPADLKGNKIIDLRPQTGRESNTNFSQTYGAQFDLNKGLSDNTVQVAFNQGTKFIRIKKNLTGLIAVNEADSLTANGTWVASNDTANLALDTSKYVSGSGSIQFDMDGSTTTATLTNANMTAIDLSEHEDESSMFMWMDFPDSSLITSVELRWGSDAANYWSQTVTAPHFGAFVNGWNLLRFAWDGATETGTGVSSAVNYLQVNITYDGTADTNLRIDNVTSNKGKIFNVVYYSKYLFTDGTTGAWKEAAEGDTDTVNLDTESYNLWLYRAAELAAQQIEKVKDDTNYFSSQFRRALSRYKSMYKSEVMHPQNSYYRVKSGRSSTRILP